MTTQTKTVTQWRREWRRLFKASIAAAHALPEYAALEAAHKAYREARRRMDISGMDELNDMLEAASQTYRAAASRLPHHDEMRRIDAMLREFDTYGHAAGVRA